MPIHSGEDRRRLLPLAVVQALTALVDSHVSESGSSSITIELKNIVHKLCRVYSLDYPWGVARETDVMQHVAEEDGDAIPPTI